MERYFITGSTGFIGKMLTNELIGQNKLVHLLVRDRKKAAGFIHPNVTIFDGDITDQKSVETAMKGCTHVFHMAAYAKASAPEIKTFDIVNIEGTRHVLKAALKNKVTKVVFTSTSGTFGPTSDTEDATEETPKPSIYYTDYARTKRIAEKLCDEYIQKDLSIVTVNPTRVFGPGLISESNSLTKILKMYNRGTWRIIPGNGKTYGNYVYVDDVVQGHLLAMDKGKPGENYILGGENLTFNGLFSAMGKATGNKRFLLRIPYPFLWFGTTIMATFARIFNKKPLISPQWIKRYLQHRRLSSEKAVNQLGYKITPVKVGLTKTLMWLKEIEK